MERSEGDMLLKNPVTTPGIDLGTVRPVAQRLNHYDTPDTCKYLLGLINTHTHTHTHTNGKVSVQKLLQRVLLQKYYTCRNLMHVYIYIYIYI
jgi:hypothetical protein